MVCQLWPWRLPEGQDTRWDDPLDEGFYQTEEGKYMVEMLPMAPRALSMVGAIAGPFFNDISMVPELLSKQAHWLLLTHEIKASFHSCANRCMDLGAETWWESHKLKNIWGFLGLPCHTSGHMSDLKFCKSVGRTHVSPHAMGLYLQRQRETDGQRKVGTTDIHSCFLTADSFQKKHEEYAIPLEMKFAYFSRILAFLKNKMLSIPKANLENAEFYSN